jgi:flap endonuclease-1
MLGCDYCDTIRGVGPKTALKLIREHKSIEGIIQALDRKKFIVPDSWVPNEKAEKKDLDEGASTQDEESPPIENKPIDEEDEEELIPAYVQARKLFNDHEVLGKVDLKWKPCNVPGKLPRIVLLFGVVCFLTMPLYSLQN